MAIATPLRYPGGKSVMTTFFKEFISVNNMTNVTYAEPYAGGAGAALNLLMEGHVEHIVINDASIPVFSFWKSLINHSDAFMELFESRPVNISEWKRQKKIFLNDNKEFSVELGFATFFLNRCNRSGILKAGAIGGNSAEKQKIAKYKIDARFNKDSLRTRLHKIIENNNRIEVSNFDAIDFLSHYNNLNINDKQRYLIYLDPPYYVHGSELYMNSYVHEDHQELARALREIDIIRWVLSYDNVNEIRELYDQFDLYTFDLKYTVQTAKVGKELLCHSQNSILPEIHEIARSSGAIPLTRIP